MNRTVTLFLLLTVLLLPLRGELLSLTPGVTTRGEAPDTWTLDLRGKTATEAQTSADGISSRLYGARDGSLHQPLQILCDFADARVLAFRVDVVSRNGSTLRIERDGAEKAVLDWPAAVQTWNLDATYTLTLEPGPHSVTLEVTGEDVTLIGLYTFTDNPDPLPGDSQELVFVPLSEPDPHPIHSEKADGYRGIWFTLGQPSEYGDKYSGGLGTYTANHKPLAVYSAAANKTFFVYGGAPAADQRYLLCMAGAYDHATGEALRPTIVYDKGVLGVDDPHDNPAVALDASGYVWVFVAGRNTSRDGVLLRSVDRFSIDAFEELRTWDSMTYPQVWTSGNGFDFFFTKYTAGRELYFTSSPDTETWSAEQKLAGFGGHYQVSGRHAATGRLGTFFNYHPGGDVNKRTNLYYMQSDDGGVSWTTAGGDALSVPLTSKQNTAQVVDYEAQGLLQYTCDLNWDADGNPLLLYVVSSDYRPGPATVREWRLTRWTGEEWETSTISGTTHNYDMGSLYVEGSRWTALIPTGTGPQAWGAGGEVEVWTTDDAGATWVRRRGMTRNSSVNHGFVRRPVNAKDPFSAFWADGNSDILSPSHLYFGNHDGTRVWQLPYTMSNDREVPVEVDPPFERWQSGFFDPAERSDPEISGPAKDPDGDGTLNLLEYVLNMNPKQTDAPEMIPGLVAESGETYFTLTFSRSVEASGVRITPRLSFKPEGPWITGTLHLQEVFRQRFEGVDGEMEMIRIRSKTPVSEEPVQFLSLEFNLE